MVKATCWHSFLGAQRRSPGDCLTKTQVCAKGKPYVYRLTPAQCWKVKGRGESLELKPQ
tara:strand:- start:377 stop:553 length:177 start_codon:yes stop_codon:yes gene_type:complete